MADKNPAIKSMFEILKAEYGIKSEAELDRAIRKLSVIDTSPFCGELIKRKTVYR